MFGSLEILYLFLGGTGAGLCFTASSLGLFSPKQLIAQPCGVGAQGRMRWRVCMPAPYRRLLGPASAIAAVLMALGALSLMGSLGRADRVLALFVPTSFTWANFGAIVLVACIVLALVNAFVASGLLILPFRTYRVLGVTSTLMSTAVALYTGLLLYSLRGAPFWRSPFLPLLFVFSSCSCGIGTLALSALAFRAFDQFKELLSAIMRVDFVVVALETLSLLGLLLMPAIQAAQDTQTLSAMASIQDLLTGSLAFPFWGLFVCVGLAAPLAIEFVVGFRRRGSLEYALPLLSGAILVGGAALRYCMVLAATHPFLGAALAF